MANLETGVEYSHAPGADGSAVDSTARAAAAAAQATATAAVPLTAKGSYTWVWADAAARLAQSVTTAQVGALGFQTDIGLEYRLRSYSPAVWARLEDTTFGAWKFLEATVSAGFSAVGCAWGTANVGTIGNRVITTTSKCAATPRTICQTVAATAGSTFYSRAGAVQQAVATRGYRLRGKVILGTVTPNMKWFVGVANTLGAPSSVLTPQSQLSCLMIGRDTEANVQMYWNDNSGACSQVDVGSSFPSVTSLLGYDFEFYLPVGGTTGAWQITHLDTGACVSGSFSSNIPTSSDLLLPCIYVTNGTDAVQASVDIAWFGYQTKE
jgi:hypothetical protein